MYLLSKDIHLNKLMFIPSKIFMFTCPYDLKNKNVISPHLNCLFALFIFPIQ